MIGLQSLTNQCRWNRGGGPELRDALRSPAGCGCQADGRRGGTAGAAPADRATRESVFPAPAGVSRL